MNDQTAKEIAEANELIEQLKSHNGTIIFILIFSPFLSYYHSFVLMQPFSGSIIGQMFKNKRKNTYNELKVWRLSRA